MSNGLLTITDVANGRGGRWRDVALTHKGQVTTPRPLDEIRHLPNLSRPKIGKRYKDEAAIRNSLVCLTKSATSMSYRVQGYHKDGQYLAATDGYALFIATGVWLGEDGYFTTKETNDGKPLPPWKDTHPEYEKASAAICPERAWHMVRQAAVFGDGQGQERVQLALDNDGRVGFMAGSVEAGGAEIGFPREQVSRSVGDVNPKFLLSCLQWLCRMDVKEVVFAEGPSGRLFIGGDCPASFMGASHCDCVLVRLRFDSEKKSGN